MSGKARRGSGEGSVYQDTKGVWHAKLNLGRYKNGKRRFKEFQGKRKADVIARRDVYLREHGDLSLESGANIPFADYITRWIENVKRNEQKEATHNRAVSTAKTYIIPMIGGYSPFSRRAGRCSSCTPAGRGYPAGSVLPRFWRRLRPPAAYGRCRRQHGRRRDRGQANFYYPRLSCSHTPGTRRRNRRCAALHLRCG